MVYHQLNKAESLALGPVQGRDALADASAAARRWRSCRASSRRSTGRGSSRRTPATTCSRCSGSRSSSSSSTTSSSSSATAGVGLPEQTGSYDASGQDAEAAARERKAAGRAGGAAAAEGRRRPRGVRLHALLPRRAGDQLGGRGGRGGVQPRRAHGARSTCCSTCSRRRPTAAIRDEILGTLEALFPNLLNARDFRTAATVLRECHAAARSARRAWRRSTPRGSTGSWPS